ncbi:16S rRNA (guanine(527)-N(7))-methyltransferase RsmG, partial [Streptomyces sp. 900116325]
RHCDKRFRVLLGVAVEGVVIDRRQTSEGRRGATVSRETVAVSRAVFHVKHPAGHSPTESGDAHDELTPCGNACPGLSRGGGLGRMFHVELVDEQWDVVGAVARVFGERAPLAEAYHASLASDGVVRGLIGPREVPRLWSRHVLNCGVLGELVGANESVVDVGSGAGLPGVPLAIARPDVRVTLVEPLLRRSVYLQEIVDDIGLDNVRVVRGRAEEPGVVKEVGGADVVTSRAVAPLEKLARWSLPLVRVGGRMLALKGSSAAEEISRDRASLTRLGAGKLDVVECGVEALPVPTIVVSAERVAQHGRRHR